MNQSVFADHHRTSRTFIACLIISLMILSPLAPLASGAPSFSKRLEAAPTLDPAAPLAPSITATKTDSFPDPDMDGQAAPGETITYDVNITNGGPDDATDVNFLDTIDANTTIVAGSLKVSPLAFPDTYVAAQNTPLSVGAPGVLTNDTGLPAPTAVPIAGGATSQGGTVTLNADGSFSYTPPAGFTGADTFTYTATNGLTPNDTALVTINVDAAPSVTATTPVNGATDPPANTNITITFSEPVNVTGDWFQISCATSGIRNVADTVVTGGPTTFTINPNTDFAATETCTVTVFAAQVSDQDANDPPDNMAANFVFSFTTSAVEAAPTVNATTPTNGAVDQAVNTDVTVTFSEPVNVTGNWFQIVCTSSGTRNPADTVVTGGPTTFTINPNVDFAGGETCTVTIFAAQVADQDTSDPPDNMAANFVFSFSTDAAPTVTATTPTNGANQVANNTNVSITFSEPVDVTGNWFQLVGATSGTRNVADTVVTGGPTTFTINPNVDFANGELVTVTVFAAQVADQDTGDPPQNMAANFVFSFTIDQAPSVTATTPTNGATNQAINTNIAITFNEAVNVTGNWFQIACATSGTRNVADTVVTGGPTSFTINPNADFANAEVCTVTVFAAQVTDQDSGDPPDNMTANFVFSFTTIDVAPTVTATTPTNGAINQATNTDVSVTFSEPVNVAGNWFQIVCTSSGTRNVADTVVTGGPTTFTINPNVDFTAGETCTTTIFAAQVTDQDSVDPPDNMAANFVFSFSMDAAPTVTATVPTNGATQVANNTNVSITFSEPVDVTGNWFQLVGATSGTRNVADTVVTGGPTTFTINPNVDFANGELVTVTIFAAQVSDQDGNDPPQNMAANFVFSFTIDQAPSVTTTVPTNGAIDILKGSNIVVNFSENVNVTTSSFSIQCPAPGNLQAFAVSGSGTNAITLNPTADLPPGVICTVTVIANQVSDTDAGDPPDNMVADFVFSFGVKPEATDDARNATGNIRIQTAGNSNFSVLTNDIGPGITVTLSDTTSLRGGNVAVAANGTFSYNPPAGYEGPDSFNYTIANAAGSDVGTVNITIAGMIWFIDDNPASGACTTNNNICGRLTNPFSTLASFEAVNGNATPVNGTDVIAPEAGDHIFIFSGNYTAPLTLEANQRVIGQGATSSLQVLSGITPATDSDTLPATGGTAPSITSAGNGFNVVSNNQLYGLAFSNTGGAAINSNANVGTFILGDVTITNSGSNGAGLVLDDGGTSVTSTGINTITTRSGVGLSLTNSTTIGGTGLTFRSISVGNNDGNADPANGIVLNTTGAGGLFVTGNAGTCTIATPTCTGGTIQNTTSHGIQLTSAANVQLTRMNLTSNDGSGIFGTTVNGFKLDNSLVTNNADSAAPDESGIELANLIGSAIAGANPTSITNSTISNNFEFQIQVTNTTGTLTDLQMSGNTISGNGAGAIGNLFNFLGLGTATMKLTLTSGTFTGNAPATATGVNCDHSGTGGTLTCNVSGATFTNNNVAVTVSQANGGNLKFALNSNTATGNRSHGLNLFINATGNGTVDGSFTNNTVGTVGVDDSGSLLGFGIRIQNEGSTAGAPNANVLVSGNTVREISSFPAINVNQGIVAAATRGTNVTITNNVVSGVDDSRAILVSQNNTTTGGFTCADISGNEMNNIAGQVGDGTKIRLRQLAGGTFNLRQGNVAQLAAANSPPNGVAVTTTTVPQISTAGTITFNTGACTAPSLAPEVETSDGLAKATQVDDRKPTLSTKVKTLTETATESAAVAVQERQSIEQSNAVLAHASRPTMELNKSKRESGTTLRSSQANGWLTKQTLSAQQKKPRGDISVRPTVVPLAGETVTHSVGTLLAGKTVHIQFQVTVNNPYLGGLTVANQGTVSGSNFSNVLTDDPAVAGANNPTETPILQIPSASVADAQANEPASGSAPMLFTISLSAPAGASGASVHYETADQPPALGHAVAGVDYTAVPDTVLNFAAGEQFKTVSVNILFDGAGAEPDETFLLNLSNPTNASIGDGQAIGTIKQGNAAGTFLISELRTSGPGGAGDDFVEVYNNSDSPLTIAASDASAGYGLFKMGADCSATPVLIGTIPNGTVIPARGHYLFTGSTYSLGNYGGTGAAAGNLTLSADIESDRNVGIFNTSSVANLSSVTRLDAVGFGTNTGGNCDLLREGTTLTPLGGSVLEHSYVRDECGKKGNPAIFGPCPTNGLPKDSNVNNDDFIFVDTTGASTPAGQRLGAPGPQNLASPLLRQSTIATLLLDSNIGAPAPPNRVRDLTPAPANGANGTLSIRRRFLNNTGAPITRLRFRLVDISSLSVPGGIADLRALTSSNVTVTGVTDTGTCQASNGVPTTPCSVLVLGTTLEQPPTQAMGGAHNSSMTAGTITLGTPLASGASINLQFVLGVQQTGSFKFFFNIEALP